MFSRSKKINALFKKSQLQRNEELELDFLIESKNLFLSRPIRFWIIYVLLGVVSLAALFFKAILVAKIVSVLNFLAFTIHAIIAKRKEIIFFNKWNRKLSRGSK